MEYAITVGVGLLFGRMLQAAFYEAAAIHRHRELLAALKKGGV
jgi:hypothetical protein